MSDFVNTVDSIGDENLTNRIIGGGITEIKDNHVSIIGSYAFYGKKNLKTAIFIAVTEISQLSFYECSSLTTVDFPSVTSIGNSAFYKCTSLTTFTFKSTPTEIHSNTFSNCSNLTTINVPWAEGEVANAPWGATNATINYNYTGE